MTRHDRRAALAALMAAWMGTFHASGRAAPGGAAAPAGVTYGNFNGAALGVGAATNGAIAFPADNPWNTDISRAPVDPNSDAIIASIGSATPLHPDFGSGLYEGGPIGIPYVIVDRKQVRVPIHWKTRPGAGSTGAAYGDESDPGPYPVPRSAPVEGGKAGDGDRHVLVIDRDENRLYELFRAFPAANGAWDAESGAVFHLDSNQVRPTAQPGWTSADAAGLPIFPGLVRYEEAALGAGGIRHALRFTVRRSRRAYVPPATHFASRDRSPDLPPMGMRVRLKASYHISPRASPEVRAILTAMKTYGMLMADNGGDWFVSGAPDDRWDNGELRRLKQVKGQDFEVIRMDGLVAP
jgi:hypothetical protein